MFVSLAFHPFSFSSRQKDMQRHLEKIADMVRLIVQKMEIRTEMDGDDVNRGTRNENLVKMQRIRQALNAARRFSRARSIPQSNISYLHNYTDDA